MYKTVSGMELCLMSMLLFAHCYSKYFVIYAPNFVYSITIRPYLFSILVIIVCIRISTVTWPLHALKNLFFCFMYRPSLLYTVASVQIAFSCCVQPFVINVSTCVLPSFCGIFYGSSLPLHYTMTVYFSTVVSNSCIHSTLFLVIFPFYTNIFGVA